MKKKFSGFQNKTLLPLMVIIVCLGICIFLENVYADTLRSKSCYKKTSSYNTYTQYSSKSTSTGSGSLRVNNNGYIVFCVEQGVPIVNSSRSFKVYKLGDSTFNKGIGYGVWYVDSDGKASLSCSNRWIAGQIFVHMASYYAKLGNYTSGTYKDKNFLTLTDSELKSAVKSMISESSSTETTIANHVVQARVLYTAHNKKLSFESVDKSKKINQFDSCVRNADDTYTCKKVVQETSGWLTKIQGLSDSRFHYTTSAPSGTTLSRSGDKITIKSVIPASDIDEVVTVEYSRKTLSDESKIKKSIVGGNVQDLGYMSEVITETDTTKINLYPEVNTTQIKVDKVLSTTNAPLKDIELYLYDDKNCTIKSKDYHGTEFTKQVTGADGKATWTGVIPDNTYYVGEPDNKKYEKLCKIVYPITYNNSTNQDYINVVKNVPKGLGVIEIQKNNSYTSTPLKGRLFGVYSDANCQISATDANGKELEETQTDENGIVRWENIAYPADIASSKIYYVKEIFSNESDVAGDGYAINRNASIYSNAKNYCIPVVMKEKDKAFVENNKKVLKIDNHPYGNLTILKQDEKSGLIVEGATFAIYKTDGKTRAVDINGKVIPASKTDAAGVAKFENVPYGQYLLRETSAPKAYKKLSKDFKFTLNDNTNSVKYQGQKLIGVSANQSNTSYKLGDVDGDEKVTEKDLSIVKEWVEKISKGENIIITASQRYAADVNEDGLLNQKDVDLINDYVTNKNKNAFRALKHGVFILGTKPYSLGDPNDDGKVDNLDFEIAKKIYIPPAEPFEYTENQYYACDLNNDGVVDSKDLDLFEMYIGNKIKEKDIPAQLSIDLKKIDYNKDNKKDLKDIYFLKGVASTKSGEINDYTYDLNEDGKVTNKDLELLTYYISKVNDARAFNVKEEGFTNAKLLEAINNVYKYYDMEIVESTPTTPTEGTETNPVTPPEVSNDELRRYDYVRDNKIDINDIVAMMIDYGVYKVNYDGDELSNIDNSDKELLQEFLNGIANKDSAEFIYDINSDGNIDSTDYAIYKAYLDGDKNIFESIKISNDVNNDGNVTEEDLNAVKNAIANNQKDSKYDTNNDGVVDNQDLVTIKKSIGGYQEFNLLEEMYVSYNEKVSIVVTNVPLDIKLSKQAITNSKEIKGAKITIKDSQGKKVIEYVSTTKPQTFAIPAGTYTLTEKVAPAGYQKLKTTVKFKVGTDGNVKLLNAKSSLYKIKKTKTYGERDHLIIYNEPKTIPAPNTGSVTSFLQVFSGIALVSFGGYAIYRKYKKAY